MQANVAYHNFLDEFEAQLASTQKLNLLKKELKFHLKNNNNRETVSKTVKVIVSSLEKIFFNQLLISVNILIIYAVINILF